MADKWISEWLRIFESGCNGRDKLQRNFGGSKRPEEYEGEVRACPTVTPPTAHIDGVEDVR